MNAAGDRAREHQKSLEYIRRAQTYFDGAVAKLEKEVQAGAKMGYEIENFMVQAFAQYNTLRRLAELVEFLPEPDPEDGSYRQDWVREDLRTLLSAMDDDLGDKKLKKKIKRLRAGGTGYTPSELETMQRLADRLQANLDTRKAKT